MTFLATIVDGLSSSSTPALIEVRGRDLRTVAGTVLLDQMQRARTYLRQHGVHKGDTVALIAPNDARWVAADLAILAQGAIEVALYARQAPAEMAVMLADCGTKVVLVADDETRSIVREVWGTAGTIGTFDEVFATERVDQPLCECAADDVATIIYTSGTSGRPKGVMLTWGNCDFMIPKMIERLRGVTAGRSEPDRVFHFLPFCFAASHLVLWMMLVRHHPLMLSTDLSKLVEEMGAAKPHYFQNVPAVLERIRTGVQKKVSERGGVVLSLFRAGEASWHKVRKGEAGWWDHLLLRLASPVFRKIKAGIGENLEFLICGSAPLSEDTQVWFEMIGLPIYQGYGLTETTGIVSLDEPGRIEPGRVGYAIDGIELSVSAEGELLVRGPNVFRGYWNLPAETAEVLRDGWFHTGDQVDLEGGNLKIVGRLKNLIIPTSGHNIAPEPLEQKFLEYCPEAEQCIVVGDKRPHLGLLITGGASAAQVEGALAQLNASAPHYKKIHVYRRTSEAFTVENGLLTANQKLRRRQIVERFAADVEEMFS